MSRVTGSRSTTRTQIFLIKFDIIELEVRVGDANVRDL
jgi:hypothetical protein